MKKLIRCLVTVSLLSTFVPLPLSAEANTPSTSIGIGESDEVNALLGRLDEIKAMDKSKLNSAEKRNLRKEVRGIKKDLKEKGDGVYISVAAIIIIALLLILLL